MASEPTGEGWSDEQIRAKLEGLTPEQQQELAELYARAETPEEELAALAKVAGVPSEELALRAEDAPERLGVEGPEDPIDQALFEQVEFLQGLVQQSIYQLSLIQAALMLRGRR